MLGTRVAIRDPNGLASLDQKRSFGKIHSSSKDRGQQFDLDRKQAMPFITVVKLGCIMKTGEARFQVIIDWVQVPKGRGRHDLRRPPASTCSHGSSSFEAYTLLGNSNPRVLSGPRGLVRGVITYIGAAAAATEETRPVKVGWAVTTWCRDLCKKRASQTYVIYLGVPLSHCPTCWSIIDVFRRPCGLCDNAVVLRRDRPGIPEQVWPMRGSHCRLVWQFNFFPTSQ